MVKNILVLPGDGIGPDVVSTEKLPLIDHSPNSVTRSQRL